MAFLVLFYAYSWTNSHRKYGFCQYGFRYESDPCNISCFLFAVSTFGALACFCEVFRLWCFCFYSCECSIVDGSLPQFWGILLYAWLQPFSNDAPRSEERRVGKECRSRWTRE